MRQETNNEIDLLLRRLSRRQDGSAPNGDLHTDTDHLDADELSSYAENALPAAARSRYTEHLAECSRCRELVVQLNSAAGVVVAEESARISAPSGFRKFLASLFSPMVLRYAVPALGLVVVAVIGFTVFRREGPLGNMTARAPAPAQQPAPNSGFVYDSPSQSGSPAAIADLRGQRKEVQTPPPKPQPSASVAADVAAEPAAPVTKTDSEAVANAAPPPAPKAVETRTDEIRKQEPEAQKAEEAQKKAEGGKTEAAATPAQQTDRAFSQAPAEAKQPLRTASREAKRGAVSAAPTAGTGSIASLRDGVEKDRSDGEMRSAGGRRFRKQGGVWVDTAYSNQATTDFTRGSEGYRTLVADEPTIKRIAEELDGQIIVVWKGRAYKIR